MTGFDLLCYNTFPCPLTASFTTTRVARKAAKLLKFYGGTASRAS